MRRGQLGYHHSSTCAWGQSETAMAPLLPAFPDHPEFQQDTSYQRAEQNLRSKLGATLHQARVLVPVAIKWSLGQMNTGICLLKPFILGNHGNLSLLLGGK